MTDSSLADFMSRAAQQLHRRLLDRRSDLVAVVRSARFDALAELHDFGLVDVDVIAGREAAVRIVVRLEPGETPDRDDARPLPDDLWPLVTDAASGVRPDDEDNR